MDPSATLERFHQEQIAIPFPTRELHLVQIPA